VLYAIGDIHGEREALEALIEALPLRDDDRLIFMGDYVDRGADSRGVVDFLIDLAKQRSCIFLIGNHESMFLDFLGWEDRMYFAGDAFLMNGGDRTLISYDYFASDLEPTHFKLPKSHEAFFRRLKLHHREGDYLFVHAGLSNSALNESDVEYALRRTDVEDFLWNRTTGDLPHKLGITIVYGHTPATDLQVRWNSPFSIGIDTGAVYGGKLTAIRLPDETIFQV
jgi:serine/threonine protein phosphatase 1